MIYTSVVVGVDMDLCGWQLNRTKGVNLSKYADKYINELKVLKFESYHQSNSFCFWVCNDPFLFYVKKYKEAKWIIVEFSQKVAQ